MLAQVSDDELLQRLIGRRIKGHSLVALLELGWDELAEAGLSNAEASVVTIAAEVARRHQPRDPDGGPIRDPAQVVSLLGDLRLSASANLILMLLDRRNRLMATICIGQSAKGCPKSSPTVLTEHAQRAGAASVILAHTQIAIASASMAKSARRFVDTFQPTDPGGP